MLMRQKVFSILALLLMAASGAQAQTETLLTTITATGKEQASYSTANVATVSFSYTAGGSSAYLANWGWWGYGWSATVNAAEGYTITKCIFYDDANRTATDSEAPFLVETTEEDKTPRINGTPIDGGNMQSKGIKEIEVYGYAPAAIFAIDTDGTTQDFGSVEADATAQKSFTVSNNGNATLNVSFAATGDFTVTDPASSRKFWLTDNFGWSTGYAYAWDSNGKALLGEWPGTACGETTNDYGETMFAVIVPSNAAGVIVNNGNGAQTVDITNFTQGYWMDGSKDGSGHYRVEGYDGGSEETPAVLTVPAGMSRVLTVTMNTATLGSKSGNITLSFDAKNATSFTIPCTGEVAAPATYIVAGNYSEIFGIPWYGTYEANKMTKGGDGKYTKTYNVEDAFSDIQLKVVKDGEDWIGDETGNNVTFSMKQAGSFTVTLDPNANPVYVTVTGDNVVLANTEYAINYATGMQNGTVTGPDTAKEDDEVTLTITPAAGYVLERISVTGVTTENAVEVTDGKFTMPAEDVNVIATFKLVTYAITLAEGTEDAANWTVSPNPAEAGQTVTISYTGTMKVKSIKAVKKAAPAPARTLAEATAEDLGKVVGADGNIYDSKDAASTAGTTAVAMIAYVGSDTDHATYKHGLAIALADESDSNLSTAKSTCEGKSAVANAAWLLPSENQWKAMFKAFGDNDASWTGLNTAITTAGGTALQENKYYWSSSELGENRTCCVYLWDDGEAQWEVINKNSETRARACLAF